MVEAIPPSGKYEDSVWQKLFPPYGNTRILRGSSNSTLMKTQGFCVVEAGAAVWLMADEALVGDYQIGAASWKIRH